MTKNPDEGPLRGDCARAGRGAGIAFIDKLFCVMEQKTYELVAWTEGSRVKMVGSLAYEQSESFVREIDELVESYGRSEDKMEYLLRISAVNERFGNFLLQCGCRLEAFGRYCDAAGICLCGPDIYWLERGRGYTLSRRLRERFFAMYDLCKRMVSESPEFEGTFHNMMLERDRRSIATD